MDYKKNIMRADRALIAMEHALAPINKILNEILEDDGAHVLYQMSDGWTICYGDGNNATISNMDINKLLKMNESDAIAYLDKYGI